MQPLILAKFHIKQPSSCNIRNIAHLTDLSFKAHIFTNNRSHISTSICNLEISYLNVKSRHIHVIIEQEKPILIQHITSFFQIATGLK